MKTIYLVHGWGGADSDDGWFGWLKSEARERGFRVISFNMPNSEEPVIHEWLGFLKEKIKEVNDDCFFVGHSVGCQAILRYIEGLDEKKKIGGCIFVAGWFNLKQEVFEEEGEETERIAKPWVQSPIDFKKIKLHTQNFTAIFSDNDPFVSLSDAEIFRKKLGAKIIIKHNEAHFNESERIDEILEGINY